MVEHGPPEGLSEQLSPEQILRSTVSETTKLATEANNALRESDAITYIRKLRERANLIVGLPARLEASMARGNNFPSEDLRQLKGWRQLAMDALDTDQTGFQLGTLFIPIGSKKK